MRNQSRGKVGLPSAGGAPASDSTLRTNALHVLITAGLIVLLELWEPTWRRANSNVKDPRPQVRENAPLPPPPPCVKAAASPVELAAEPLSSSSNETLEREQLAACRADLQRLQEDITNLTARASSSDAANATMHTTATKKRCRAPKQLYTDFPTVLGDVEVDYMPIKAQEGVYLPFPQKACVERTLQWLQRRDHLSGLDAIGWSKDFAILGLVIVTDGKGNIWSMEPKNDEFRGQDQMTFVYRYARKLKRETIFFMTMNDVDVWYLVHGSREEDLKKLLEECPAWYLHWNPRVDQHGRLQRRTLPIPDPYRYSMWIRPPPSEKPADKAGRLVYRGATLGQSRGMNRDFYSSDRYKCVKELQQLEGSDVRFHQYTWNIREDRAPWSAKSLTQDEMAQQYGAVLDVDGNANTWEGLRWKMGLGGAVFKADSTMGFIQWFYPELENGKHLYVFSPEGDWNKIRVEMKALLDTSIPYEKRPTTRMGLAAHEFAKTHFTREAMRDYIKRLIPYVWENETALGKMDWRIRGTESLT